MDMTRLQPLALTSQLSRVTLEWQDETEASLCRTGTLAQQMPKLHLFVLWYRRESRMPMYLYIAQTATMLRSLGAERGVSS